MRDADSEDEMGGSGGSSTFSEFSPLELQRRVRAAELESADKEFGPVLAKRLAGLLAKINDRDVHLTRERLTVIEDSLSGVFDDAIELRYGGSVAKHTYVDGLSDVDLLLIVDGDGTPKGLTDFIVGKILQAKIDADVKRGNIAITLTYDDGEQIQLVPAIRLGDRLHVPAWTGNSWSKINPEKFNKGLRKRNAENAGKVIPVIKLMKSVNSSMSDDCRLSGYHIESMAISAFRNYDGIKTVEKMLPFFAREVSRLVRAKIKDSSGQSVHVDEYLGKSGSTERLLISRSFERLAKNMDNATTMGSIEQWNKILGA